MAQQQAPQDNACTACNSDDCADALATVAVVAIFVATIVYWLSGMA